MIRQAHTYLVGALSGTVLIGVAIAVFVVLVSTQVFTNWPVSLGSGAPAKTEVSDARSASDGTAAAGQGAFAAAKARAIAAAAARRDSAAAAAARRGGKANVDAIGRVAHARAVTSSLENPIEGGEAPADTGGSHEGASGGSPSPASPAPTPAPTAGGGGPEGVKETGTPTSGGGGKESPTPTPKTVTEAVTETVHETVNGVTETVTGSPPPATGVTEVTEEVVNGVAGPESVVGHTVDEATKGVGGVLGGGK